MTMVVHVVGRNQGRDIAAAQGPLVRQAQLGLQLGRPDGSAYGAAVCGYEIHHGIVTVEDAGAVPFLDGCRVASTWGTSWHGTLENDAFRRAFLAEVAELAGRDFTAAPDTCFAAMRRAQLDVMGDLVAAHLDTAVLGRLIGEGPPPGCRSSARRARRCSRADYPWS